MQRNMNSSPPRLPRLGGHKSAPTRKPSPPTTAPSGPTLLGPSARIEPACASSSPERPYIDVGYDDDDIPNAQQQVHLLSSLRGTTPSTPHQQAPSPPRPGRPSPSPSLSSSSNVASQSWKEQVRSEVLLGPTQPTAFLFVASPTAAAAAAAAAASRDEISSDDVDDTTQNSPDGDGEAVSDSLFPAMPAVLSTNPDLALVTSSPGVVPLVSIPRSPVSVASSIATDTPRSILRHPGRERDTQTLRSGRRRISFVDLSPLRDDSRSPDERRRIRESLSGEDDDDDDEYDFAEPLLRYETEAPPLPTSTSPRHSVGDRQAHTRTATATPPSPRTPDRHRSNGHHAPRTHHRSPSSSPERPVAAGRSPTRSPPRDAAETRPPRATQSVAAASAPPPPEEENDLITLDVASPPCFAEQQQAPRAASPTASPLPQRSPDRSRRAHDRASPRRGDSNGREDDVLTQPHTQGRPSHTSAASAAEASAGRRPPTRQRWPSDAYVDEPPTEVSVTQRASRGGGHRESLDPEDDMGSSQSSRSGSDISQHSSSDYESSDDGPSFRYETPVKEPQHARRGSASRPDEAATNCARTASPTAASPLQSPHRNERARDRTASPSQSQPRSPRSRLPQRRQSRSASESRASSVVSNSPKSGIHYSSTSSSRERPIPSTPPSLTDVIDSGVRQRHSLRLEERTSSSLNHSTLLPSPEETSRVTKRGEVVPATGSREASSNGSRGRSPSTITNRSSGQSFAEETAPAQPTNKRAAATESRAAQEEEPKTSHRLHDMGELPLPRSSSSRHSSADSSPAKKAEPAAHIQQKAAISRKKKKIEREEPQVYVDPLLRERQHRHEVARQQSPTHQTRRAPSSEAVAFAAEDGVRTTTSQPHRRHSSHRASQGSHDEHGGAAFEPLSLRDIMARHDSPESKSQRPLSPKQSSRAASVRSSSRHEKTEHTRKQAARPILREAGPAKGKTAPDTNARATASTRSSLTRHNEEALSESSRLSSGGVPAEELVWDAPTPRSRAGSSSPPLSPSPSSTALATDATTPGGHKVFRKKLVVVVRRRRSGAAPSEDDPVTQMSMVPYREGSPAVKRAEERQAAVRRQHTPPDSGAAVNSAGTGSVSAIGAVSASTAAGAAPLERLIDHIQPGRKSLVSSRRTTRNTQIREERVGEVCDGDGEDSIAEEDRRRFRRALSVISSRSASRRSSVTPTARSRRSRSGSVMADPPQLVKVPQEQNHQNGSSNSSEKAAPRSIHASASEHPSVIKARQSRSSSVTSAHPTPTSVAVAAEEKMPKGVADTRTTRKDEATMTPSRHRHRHVSVSHRGAAETGSSRARRARSSSSTNLATAETHRGISEERRRRQQALSASQSALPDAHYRATQNDESYFGAGLENEVAEVKARAAPRIGITSVNMPLLPRLRLAADRDGRADVHGVTAWSASDSDGDGITDNANRIAAAPRSSSKRQRLLLTQASATQTNRFGPVAVNDKGEADISPAETAPIARPLTGSGAANNSSPRQARTLAENPAMVAASTVGDNNGGGAQAGNDNAALHNGGFAGRVGLPAALEPDDGNDEAPASFVKRVSSSASRISTRRASPSATNARFVEPLASTKSAPTHMFPGAGQHVVAPPSAFFQPPPYMASYPSPAAASPYPTVGALSQQATSSAGVPLFVPTLTVDNVSHLSQEWQSTLRERTGKAKQDAMEHFLIASAEAGAASTLNSAFAQIPAPFGMANGMPSASGAAPLNAYGNFAVSGVAAGVPSEWDQRRWPSQLQPGLPAAEFYGQQQAQIKQAANTAAAISAVPLAAQVSPPRLLPQAFWEAEREVRQEDARAAAVRRAKQASPPSSSTKQKALIPAQRADPSVRSLSGPKAAAAKEFSTSVTTKDAARGRSSLTHPPADAFDLVEGSEAAREGTSSSASSIDDHSIKTADEIQPLARQRSRATRSLTPPTAAALAFEQSPPRHDRQQRSSQLSPPQDNAIEPLPTAAAIKPKDKTRRTEEKMSRRAAAAAAIASASSGRRRSGAPASTAFTITEPTAEKLKSKVAPAKEDRARDSRHASQHAADRHDRAGTAGVSSSATRSKETPRKDPKRKEKDEKKKNRRNASQERRHREKFRRHRSSSTAASSSSAASSPAPPFSIPDVFNFAPNKSEVDDASDIDSDMATSMEFQLSRLLLQRERTVSNALAALQQERDSAEAKEVARRKQKEEKGKKSHRERPHRHRSASTASSKSDRHKRRSREEKEKARRREKREKRKEEKKREEEEKHRAPSAEKKKAKRGSGRKEKHHRSKSVSQSEPLPLPPPPREHHVWTEDTYRARDRAEGVSGESRYSSPSYESIGAARNDGAADAATYRTSPRDRFPSRFYRAVGSERETKGPEYRDPSASARSNFRSRSNGLDNNQDAPASRYGATPYSAYRRDHINDEGLSASRYSRRGGYTPPPTSRWADTPRRSFEDAIPSPTATSAAEEFYHRTSRTARPSTHWEDYVRTAERNDRRGSREDATAAPPLSASASSRYASFGQRRQSVGGDSNSTSPRNTATNRYQPRTPSFSTASRYTPSHTNRAEAYDDMDDIPKRSYFNDDAVPPAPSTTDRAAARTQPPPPPPAPAHHRQGQRTATARAKNDDDILVSTPSQDGDTDRESSYDYWEDRVGRRTQLRRGAPPPPPPRDSLNSSTRAPSTADPATRNGGVGNGVFSTSPALPIATEHTVTDAQSAHDFAEGVKDILCALQRYKDQQ